MMNGEPTLLASLFSSDAAYRLTLSLGHTLWQAVVIGTAALLIARLLRSQSAQSRHLTYMAALLAMVLCLPANLLWIAPPTSQTASTSKVTAPENNTPNAEAITDAIATPESANPTPRPTDLPPVQPDTLPNGSESLGNEVVAAPLLPTQIADLPPLQSENPASTDATRPSLWQAAAPWVVPIYCIGLLVTGLRLMLAYRGGQQLRKLAVAPDTCDVGLTQRFRKQAQRLGFSSIPSFAILPDDLPKRFAHVGPVVIGVLKPIVLLPAAALAQMTPAQIEAVLAHELAHIKRYDPWLMLFQRAAETVLFFHPMVWLISRLASVEREHACDDLAIKAGAQPGHYAEALLHFAKLQIQSGQQTPRGLAAAALAMAEHSGASRAKALEHRLARLFGQRIANPLRLTRKGLVGLALVGLVGLTALVTTTKAQAPGQYFAEEEVVPELAYPDDAREAYPPIAMDVMYVRPTNTDLLFDGDGNRQLDTWDDAGSRHATWSDEWNHAPIFRDVIIDLPQDAPELTFVNDRHRFNYANNQESNITGAPFFAHMCYRADGTRYILLDVQINQGFFARGDRFDITLAYHAGDQRGVGELEFTGPFTAGQPFTDTTGRYQTQLDPMLPEEAWDYGHQLTLDLDRFLESRHLTVFDRDGKAYEAVQNGSSASRGPNGEQGSYEFTFHGVAPEKISRIVLNPEPRTITFRNVALAWDSHEEHVKSYAPYLDEMAKRLGVTINNRDDAQALSRREFSAEQALQVLDIIRSRNTAMQAWEAITDNVVDIPNPGDGPPQKRLTFEDYTPEQQSKIVAAAEHWIDSSQLGLQKLGLEMGLWTGDMRFWDLAILRSNQPEGWEPRLYMLMGVHLHKQVEQQHIDQLVDLARSTHNPGSLDSLMWIFRRLSTTKNTPEVRQMVIDALIDLAHDERPEVWYAALSRFTEKSWTLSDGDGNTARETVLRKIAAESDEMLRRCAIVAPNEALLGRPIPPRDQLRLEEVFAPIVWREMGDNSFYRLATLWLNPDIDDPQQWDIAIQFLDQLQGEWHQSAMPGVTRDNTFIVDHLVRQINIAFDQDFGGLGQDEEATRRRHTKNYRQIARDVVAWYRGPSGPGQFKQAGLHPSIQMDVKHVRPGFADALFSAEGQRLKETWDDVGGPRPFWDQGKVLRQVVIDLPRNTPPLHFVYGQGDVQASGNPKPHPVAGMTPYLRYRADGRPYIMLEMMIDRERVKSDLKHLDLTVAYHVGDERGPAELEFVGPFEAGKDFKDVTGQIQTRLVRKYPDAAWNHDYTLTFTAKGISIWNPEVFAYTHDGKAYRLTGEGKSTNVERPDGRYDITRKLLLRDLPPESIARIAMHEAPRKQTFTNVAMHWNGWEDREENYAPYFEAVAERLGVPCDSFADANAIARKKLTREEAFQIIGVVGGRMIGKVATTICSPQARFEDLSLEEQAAVRDAASRWIGTYEPHEYGIALAMWSKDLTKWDPMRAYLRRVQPGQTSIASSFLARYMHDQLGAEHYEDLIELARTTRSSNVFRAVMNTFANNSEVEDGERRALTEAAVLELARDDRPWVWYAAIQRIAGTTKSLYAADGELARWTLTPKLAAESPEMLRRCAVVSNDAQTLGQPVPEIEQLRLEELFNPTTMRMLRFEFRELYRRWFKGSEVTPQHWAVAINYLDQLTKAWNLQEDYQVEILVQHLNVAFGKNIGGVGSEPHTYEQRQQIDWYQIAREAVAWYRGPNGPGGMRRADARPLTIHALPRQNDGKLRWEIRHPDGASFYLSDGLIETQVIGDGPVGGGSSIPYIGRAMVDVSAKIEDGLLKVQHGETRFDEDGEARSGTGIDFPIPEGGQVVFVPTVTDDASDGKPLELRADGYTNFWEARIIVDGKIYQSIAIVLRRVTADEASTSDGREWFDARADFCDPDAEQPFAALTALAPDAPRIKFASAKQQEQAHNNSPIKSIDRADVIGVWKHIKGPPNYGYEDQDGRAYTITQTLELNKDSTAVRQTIKQYDDDDSTPISYERIEGTWSLEDPRLGDGGPGTGLYLTVNSEPVHEGQWHAHPVNHYYLGSVWSGAAKNHLEGELKLGRWADSIMHFEDWQPITAEDAAKFDPGSHTALKTAESFVAAILLNSTNMAHALTHGISDKQCANYSDLALLTMPDSLSVEHLLHQSKGEGGEGTYTAVFAPIAIPKEMVGGDEPQTMAVFIEVEQADELWRVTQCDLEPYDAQQFREQVNAARREGEITTPKFSGKPLPERIVGYRDDRRIHLFKAIDEGDTKRLGALLDKHPDWIRTLDDYRKGNSLLHEAAHSPLWRFDTDEADGQKAVAVMRLLLEKGADVKAVNKNGSTPLQRFCNRYSTIAFNKHQAGMDALRLFIKHGADANATNEGKRTVLHTLGLSGVFQQRTPKDRIAEAAALLIEAGAQADTTIVDSNPLAGYTPLDTAIRAMNPHLIKVLLDNGVDPDGSVEQDWPALHALAEARRDNNYADEKHQAPIDRDVLACAKALIEAGADPWLRVPIGPGRFNGSALFNLSGMEVTAYDVMLNCPTRDYLAEVMAPKRKTLEKEVLEISERFIRAALANDLDTARSMCSDIWMINDPHRVDEVLRTLVAQMQQQIEIDTEAIDDPKVKLPIVSVVGRLNEGAIMLKNKPGAPLPYTGVLVLKVDGHWRIAAMEPQRKNDGPRYIAGIFNHYRHAIAYNNYLATGALPLRPKGGWSIKVSSAKYAAAHINDAGHLALDWHSPRKHLATTLLGHDNTDAAIHLDHHSLGVYHAEQITLNGIKLHDSMIQLSDGTQLTAKAGRLTLTQNGVSRRLPVGAKVQINLEDQAVEIVKPEAKGKQSNAAKDAATTIRQRIKREQLDPQLQAEVQAALKDLDAETLSALLQRGADPNGVLPDGLLPLHAVVSARDAEGSWAEPGEDKKLNDKAMACARLLVDAGADPWGKVIASASRGFKVHEMELTAYDTVTHGIMRRKPLYAYLEELMQPRMRELRREVRAAADAFVRGAMENDIDAMLKHATPVWPSHRNYFPQFMEATARTYRKTIKQSADGKPFVLPLVSDWVREAEAGVLLRNREGADKPYTMLLLIHDGNGWRVIDDVETSREDTDAHVLNMGGTYTLMHYCRFAASGQAPPVLFRENQLRNPRKLQTNNSTAATVYINDANRLVVDWLRDGRVLANAYLGLPDAEGPVYVRPRMFEAHQYLNATASGMHLSYDTITLPNDTTISSANSRLTIQHNGKPTRQLPIGTQIQINLEDHSFKIMAPQPE